MQVNLIFSLLMNASTSHILTRINLRKNCFIFGKWIFYENIAKIGSNWGILLIKNNRFSASKKPVFGHWKLAKITGFPRPVKTGVSTLITIPEKLRECITKFLSKLMSPMHHDENGAAQFKTRPNPPNRRRMIDEDLKLVSNSIRESQNRCKQTFWRDLDGDRRRMMIYLIIKKTFVVWFY